MFIFIYFKPITKKNISIIIRNERKKWIHCFEDVTLLLFVVAINEYDTICEEDCATNRLHEALNLFKDIINNIWFAHTNVVLFLNKVDLFREKIQHVNMNICFPRYRYLLSLFNIKDKKIKLIVFSFLI